MRSYVSDKFYGNSSETKPTSILDGAVFYEYDTLQEYLLVNGSWQPLSGGGAGFTGTLSGITGDLYWSHLPGTVFPRTLTDNISGYVLSSGSNTHRTLGERFGDIKNVKDYGAVGDGTTDDSVSITGAYNSLSTLGGTLYFPPGIYKFNLLVNKPNVCIKGQGSIKDYNSPLSGSRFIPANLNQPLIQIGNDTQSVKGFVIQDCTLYGGSNPYGNMGLLYSGGAFECYAYNLTVWNFKNCIKLQAGTSQPCSLNHFIGFLIQPSNEGSGKGIWAVMNSNQNSFTTANYFNHGHINAPTGVSGYSVELDGTNLYLDNTYIDISSSGAGIKFTKTNPGVLDPYVICHGLRIDPTNKNWPVIKGHNNQKLWSTYLRGTVEVDGLLETSGSSFVDNPNGPQIIGYQSIANSLQVLDEIAFDENTSTAYTGGYSNNTKIYKSSKSLGIQNLEGDINIICSGNQNQNISGNVNINLLNAGNFTIASGKLGINTTSPSVPLEVSGEGPLINLVGSGHEYIQFYPSGIPKGRKGYFGYGSAGDTNINLINEFPFGSIVFGTSGNNRMVINYAGNVAIIKDAANTSFYGTTSVYQEFYPSGAGAGRKAFIGFGQPDTSNFFIANETPFGNLFFETSGQVNLTLDSSGNLVLNKNLDFNILNNNPGYREGRVFYDSGEKTLAYYNDNSNVTMNIGQETWMRVLNMSANDIVNGQAVYVSGYNVSGLPMIDLARADSEAKSQVAGLATVNIARGAIGYITNVGVVHGLDTVRYSGMGQPTLYLSPFSGGGLTGLRPNPPYFVVPVATLTKSSTNDGNLLVNPLSVDKTQTNDNQKFVLKDDFVGTSGYNIGFSTFNSGADSSIGEALNTNANFNHMGIVRLNGGTAITGYAAINLSGGFLISGITSSLEWIVKSDTISTTSDRYLYRIGWGDNLRGDHTNGMHFEYTDNIKSGWWVVKTSNNGLKSSGITTVSGISSNWNSFRIDTDLTGAHFFINNTGVADINVNLPTGTSTFIMPMCQIQKLVGGNNRFLDVDRFYLGYNYTNLPY